MHIIISNYSKNSLALIQWAAENQLEDVTVCYIDTGWAAEGWLDFVTAAEAFSHSKGFCVQRLESRVSFLDLMEIKRGFPSQKHQWCSLHLKGITLLQWLDEVDPECNATLLMAKRNSENIAEKAVPEVIKESEYHGGRRVWSPLFNADDAQRDRLLSDTGLVVSRDYSSECAPCINSSTAELSRLTEADISKTEELENDLGVPMFSSLNGESSKGIRASVQLAKQKSDDEARPFKYGCSSEFGCGS